MKYTKMELQIVRDAKAMGFTNSSIATFLNKREHAGQTVRTAEGIRKVK